MSQVFMNSVLLVGNERFITSLASQVRSLDALVVYTAKTLAEAADLVEDVSPDVAIAQATFLSQAAFAQTFTHRRQAPYVLVIDDAPIDLLMLGTSASLPHATALSFSDLHLEKNAAALEAGADAFVWLSTQRDQIAPNRHSPAHSNLDGLGRNPQEVTLIAPEVYSLSKSQRRLIQAHIQVGLNRAQRFRDLSRINDWLSAVALIDALTQLRNRRAFDLELPRQIKSAQRKAAPLSLMVLDIDYFKTVNDRYGHLVGDDVLKQLAQRLLNNMRFYDTPFRYGGEEFVITLNNTDLTEGAAIADRLRQTIANESFSINPAGSVLNQLDITVSIGITELKAEDDAQGQSLLHRADVCLLQAKAKGRNRVVKFSELLKL